MSVSAPKPTIVLVCGAWHPHNSYLNLRSRLQSLYHPVLTIQNVSLNSSSKGLLDDIAQLRSALCVLVDVEGKDVIVVAHSYGGLPAIVGVTGYGKNKRSESGKKGGVVGMLFLAAMVLLGGSSVLDAQGRETLGDWYEEKNNLIPVPQKAHDWFYNDLFAKEAQAQAKHLEPQGFLAIDQLLPVYDLADIPSIYLVCSKDKVIPAASQEDAVNLLGKHCTAERCDAGHCPFLSREDLVLELVGRLVRK